MPKTSFKHRSVWVLLAALIAAIYALYFAISFVPLTLVIDRQSRAMERLMKYRLERLRAPGFLPIEKILDSPNRSLGCSFLLMENLYRDCKAVTIARVAASTPSQIEIQALLGVAKPLLQQPCIFLDEAPAGDRNAILTHLQCNTGKSSKYLVSVAYLDDGKLVVIATTHGVIN